jgi:hypothetical protein
MEKLIFEIVASVSKSQKGDISQALADQGFFDGGPVPESLKSRSKQLSGGNPVDVKKEFFKKNPN